MTGCVKSSTWYNASPEDWAVARHRKAIIRPLAARSPLTPMVVDETAHSSVSRMAAAILSNDAAAGFTSSRGEVQQMVPTGDPVHRLNTTDLHFEAVFQSLSAARQLNHGEGRRSLARWLFFANQGEFRDGDLNEIMNKTSCLSLLCIGAVVWNTVPMQKIVEQLRSSGQTVRDEDLASVWLLLHEHILPNGIYDFAGC